MGVKKQFGENWSAVSREFSATLLCFASESFFLKKKIPRHNGSHVMDRNLAGGGRGNNLAT